MVFFAYQSQVQIVDDCPGMEVDVLVSEMGIRRPTIVNKMLCAKSTPLYLCLCDLARSGGARNLLTRPSKVG